MINVIIEASKYVLILLMALYTFWNFSFFRVQEEERQKKISYCQNVDMFLIHLLGFLILYWKTGDDRMVMLYLAQVILLAALIGLNRLFYPGGSRILVNNICMFLCVGFLILSRLSLDKAIRQFVIAAVAAFATLLIPLLINHVWQLVLIPWFYGIAGLLLLIMVWLVGNNSFGAQLSISVAGIAFQPSEFVKISFVFFVAAMFYRSREWKCIAAVTAMAGAHVLVLVLSRDLGSALIYFITYIAMLFVATSDVLLLLGGILTGCGASAAAYLLFSHVRTRVSAWMDPWSDIDNRGYQITQSLFAIGTGGWFGMGLYQGMPYKIPVVEKDFIFAAISEELGGIFAVCLILICVGCFLQFMMIASRMEALFYKLIAFGLGIEYMVQVFLTVGGVIRFIPSTGVTLPLISYGGSSVLSTFILFEVIQGLYILKRNDEENGEEYDEEMI
ncbi:MAG: FtsW/RodA/SpoVE family cell cycle protein [Clostridiales bacterium]|nr:FtsW/RodA/SpoVE family cell cycle protein [Clostridiales bacterium]